MGEAYAGRALDIRRFRYDSHRRLHFGKLWGVKENPCGAISEPLSVCGHYYVRNDSKRGGETLS